MSDNLVIIENEASDDLSNISFLKEHGIDLLQDFTGKIWTDYNIHDPGITILEVLCFAITELGYRTDYDIVDILGGKFIDSEKNSTFYQANHILTSQAVTLNDFKAVLMDLGFVKNAVFVAALNEPEFRGVYDVNVELLDQTYSEQEKKEFLLRIHNELNQQRNLNTTFGKIQFLEYDEISFDIEIEVGKKIAYSELVFSVLSGIEEYFSPFPKFNSLDELVSQGFNSEQIFNGPLLKNGFINNSSIKDHKLRETVYVSDLINVIMKLDDIRLVKKLNFKDDADKTYNWFYKVKPSKVPRINYENSHLTVYFNNGVVYSTRLNAHGSRSGLMGGKTAIHKKNTFDLNKSDREIKLSEYRSIQTNFPSNYGIGNYGVPVGAGEKREAYSKQLKGYLTIFDQVLANYFAQLDHVKNLFSTLSIDHTTGTQIVQGIPSEENIYKHFIENYIQNNYDPENSSLLKREWEMYLQKNKNLLQNFIRDAVEDEHGFLKRRNKILDHLLARFGLNVIPYEYVSQFSQAELIEYKSKLLRNIDRVSSEKYKGNSELNFLSELKVPVCGMEQLLSIHLGLPHEYKIKISEMGNLFHENDANELENGFELDVPGADLSGALETLLKFGKDKERYKEEGGSKMSFKISEKEFGYVEFINRKEPATELIMALCNKIKEIDRKSEHLHIIEHLKLRPDREMKCFGFEVICNLHPEFRSVYNLSGKERDALIDDFLNEGLNPNNYSSVEVNLHQYKNRWSFNNKELYSVNFYNNLESAQAGLEKFVNQLKESPNLNENVCPGTKYADLYNEVNDPFSYILTVVLPTWPSRFQNDAFKKYTEELIAQEMPSHNVTNIKWLNFETMKKFEEAYGDFLISKDDPSSEKREKELDEFLNLLVGLK